MAPTALLVSRPRDAPALVLLLLLLIGPDLAETQAVYCQCYTNCLVCLGPLGSEGNPGGCDICGEL